MASSLPSPLAAAIGIVPAVLEGVLRLPGRAVQFPVVVLSRSLNGVDALRREYADLADRGERLVAKLRGQAVERADELEDRVEDAVSRTPFAGAYDRAEDALEDAADATLRAPAGFAAATEEVLADVAPITGRARRAAEAVVDVAADTAARTAGAAADAATRTAGAAAGAVSGGADAVSGTAGAAAGAVDTAAGAAAGAVSSATDAAADATTSAAGAAAQVADTAVDRAADAAAQAGDAAASTAGTVADAAERAAETAVAPPAADPGTPDAQAPKGAPTPKAVEPDASRVDTAATPSVQEAVQQAVAAAPAVDVDHDQLPLPDYDHMTLGSLRGRLRALSLDQLVQTRAYEKAHADRLPVVTMLDNRIAKLATDASATPSGPVSTSPAPEQLAAAAGPAGALSPATTDAPPINPPSQGVPTNPSQPR